MQQGAQAAANFTGLNIATLIAIAIGAVLVLAMVAWGTWRRRAKAAAIRRSDEHERIAQHAIAAHAEHQHAPPAEPPAAVAAAPPAPEAMEAAERLSGDATYPLTTLKGLGPRAAAALNECGIASVADIAVLSPADAAAIDAQLGPLAGRLARDRWVEQARLLAAGDIAAFEATFGKLGG